MIKVVHVLVHVLSGTRESLEISSLLVFYEYSGVPKTSRRGVDK